MRKTLKLTGTLMRKNLEDSEMENQLKGRGEVLKKEKLKNVPNSKLKKGENV
jgi:hypothetical protein